MSLAQQSAAQRTVMISALTPWNWEQQPAGPFSEIEVKLLWVILSGNGRNAIGGMRRRRQQKKNGA
jgi:hypothetical protein